MFWEEEFTFVSASGYEFWSWIKQAKFVGCGDEIFLPKMQDIQVVEQAFLTKTKTAQS